MSQVIIYQDGGDLCVVHPAPGVSIERALQDIDPAFEARIIDASSLPQDRYFRRAWKLGADGVEVDIPTAKEVQRDVWRKRRAPKLAELDTEVLKSIERGDAKKRNELSAKKQALRDVTATDLPDDLEGIRNAFPEILL
jgi:hypothetical protein